MALITDDEADGGGLEEGGVVARGLVAKDEELLRRAHGKVANRHLGVRLGRWE